MAHTPIGACMRPPHLSSDSTCRALTRRACCALPVQYAHASAFPAPPAPLKRCPTLAARPARPRSAQAARPPAARLGPDTSG